MDHTARIKRLSRIIREDCKLRGHSIQQTDEEVTLQKDGTIHRITRLFECSACKKWVQADTNPLPNGIDIGGPAIALSCRDKEGKR